MKRFLKEPLLHFVLLGAAFFAADALRNGRTAQASAGQIFVPLGRVENLAALFVKTWQRKPTAEELRGLVDDYVLEEALYRQGMELGVDQGDTIIRRRVRQKMEFVVNDIAELASPSEQQLEDWLSEHRSDYDQPGRYRMRQIYLNPELHGDGLQADSERVLKQLKQLGSEGDPRALGDPSLLEHAYPDAPHDVLQRTFGEQFAEQLLQAPRGQWTGPLTSAYGLHFVYIDSYTQAAPPALETVRAEVLRDWEFEQRERSIEHYYEQLLTRYEVQIDWPAEMPLEERGEQP